VNESNVRSRADSFHRCGDCGSAAQEQNPLMQYVFFGVIIFLILALLATMIVGIFSEDK